MGLYAEINLRDLGFWSKTRNGGFIINYDPGFVAFQTRFRESIVANCPVRTGNLLSSIHCEISGMTIRVYTQCSYAQYVEYGTWKQMAQPYFEQAISDAFFRAYDLWGQATDRALIDEYHFVFDDVWNQVMSDPKASNSPTFAERWAHNAAVVSVKTQRDHIEIGPILPTTIIT